MTAPAARAGDGVPVDVEVLRRHLREVPDFPRPGVRFADITPLLADASALAATVEALAGTVPPGGVDVVAGVEARGFLLGTPLALALGAGFVPVRKAGKLPRRTASRRYALEYGEAELQVHEDAVRPGQRVLVVDDVLATGGTAEAAAGLVEQLGGRVVGLRFLVELAGLGGRRALAGRDVVAVLQHRA
ncbi:adenine phosphoribosyltransferase [Quadrisphaera sp. DSM 44207]|uniref:adenine phosphoribosyltransferase n=1 Tax=Quadrisphaera sp. DSM 44207 TaxID=1881057 RepID=UPI0008840558|nr:adenine phosphoribosyltransferase [Quadrisphaera sp. DSM 44207]SDQ47741.1 adenine phosphoribosyltransferase [Quadrisphaera sp. DSM 44207]